jgi:hypothetical protein
MVVSWKIVCTHFPVFGYVMENELENNLLILFFNFIKIMRNKPYKLKS